MIWYAYVVILHKYVMYDMTLLSWYEVLWCM